MIQSCSLHCHKRWRFKFRTILDRPMLVVEMVFLFVGMSNTRNRNGNKVFFSKKKHLVHDVHKCSGPVWHLAATSEGAFVYILQLRKFCQFKNGTASCIHNTARRYFRARVGDGPREAQLVWSLNTVEWCYRTNKTQNAARHVYFAALRCINDV